jgi:hypothetical protein
MAHGFPPSPLRERARERALRAMIFYKNRSLTKFFPRDMLCATFGFTENLE